jgi:hypothetical protein
MPPKFGNYLFRNLKGQTVASPETKTQSEALGSLEEQEIVLRREDIEPDGPDASQLDWSKVEEGKIKLRLKDTDGLMNGRITVGAATLQRIYPLLFSKPPASDQALKISLKAVVLQIQAHLNQTRGDAAKTVAPDFDTPIAQVAREDEGFFKLEKSAQAAMEPPKESREEKQEVRGPILTPADRPTFPLIREKPRAEERPSEPAPLEISLPRPIVENTRKPPKFDPFADLPKVGPQRNAENERETLQPLLEETAATREIRSTDASETTDTAGSERQTPKAKRETTHLKPLRRIGLERLQEIFLTDDLLDAREVAKLLARFPKVRGVLIMLNDGSLMGGELPDGYNAKGALAAPALLRATRDLNQRIRSSETSAMTIFADQPLSIFGAGNVCIVIAHEGRGLLPGMRERVCEIASALHALYGDEGDSPRV